MRLLTTAVCAAMLALGNQPTRAQTQPEACLTKSIAPVPNRQDGRRLTFSWPVVLDAVPGAPTHTQCVKLQDLGNIKTIAPYRKTTQVSVNGGTWLNTAQPIREGDQVVVRLVAPNKPDAAIADQLVFDGQLLAAASVRTGNWARDPKTWQVTTQAELTQTLTQLVAGDVVELQAGTYSSIVLSKSGTKSKPIVLRGVGLVTLTGGAVTVDIKSAHYNTLENVTITGGTEACVRSAAHGVVLDKVVVKDCQRHGILGLDYGSGDFTLSNSEVTRVGGIPAGEAVKHAVYVATDRDAFPGSTLKVINNKIHDYRGNGIKSRAAKTVLDNNYIESKDDPQTLYVVELIGYQAYYFHRDTLTSLVTNNTLVSRGIYSMRLGGDGSGASRGRVILDSNQFIIGNKFNVYQPVIRLFQLLDSVWLSNNQFTRDGSTTRLKLFRDDLTKNQGWISGQAKVLGYNNTATPGSDWQPMRTSPSNQIPQDYE